MCAWCARSSVCVCGCVCVCVCVCVSVGTGFRLAGVGLLRGSAYACVCAAAFVDAVQHERAAQAVEHGEINP